LFIKKLPYIEGLVKEEFKNDATVEFLKHFESQITDFQQCMIKRRKS
jgi:hypothetical protein